MTYRQWPSAADRANPTGGGVVVFPSPPGALTLTGLAPTVAVGGAFSTLFPAVENPLSQGGIWQLGLADGLKWTNPKTTANGCVASTVPTPNRYDDDIAHLKTSYRTFNANQFAQGTLYVAPGYTGGGGSHECELLLRFAITANNARGYECSAGVGPSGVYAFIVRWEGPEGSFTALMAPGSGIGSYANAPSALTDGDVWYAQIVGTVIQLKQNGVLILTYDTASDGTKWATGQPGLGFWPVDGATPTNQGWKAYTAGDL